MSGAARGLERGMRMGESLAQAYRTGQAIRKGREEREQGEYDALARRAQHIFYADDGTPLETTDLANDPERQAALIDFLNDRAFDDVRNAEGRKTQVTGFTPMDGGGRYAIDLEVEKGGRKWYAPLTWNRSEAEDDPVPALTLGEMRRKYEDFMRGKSKEFSTHDRKGRLVRQRGEWLGDMATSSQPPASETVRTPGLSGGSGEFGDAGAYVEGLAATESSGNWRAVNDKTGALGKWQFMPSTLDDYRRQSGQEFSNEEFLASPELQKEAMAWYVDRTDRFIQQQGLDQYIGQTVKGAPITLNGMRAAAHLGGDNGLKKFLTSGGRYDPDDGATRLSDYMARHAGGLGAAPVDPRTASAEPMGDVPAVAPASLPDRASRPSGLDAAVRMAARFPGEITPIEVERMANTGRLAAPIVSKDGLNVDVSDPYDLSTRASRRAPAAPMTEGDMLDLQGKRIKVLRDRQALANEINPPEPSSADQVKAARERLKLQNEYMTSLGIPEDDFDGRRKFITSTALYGVDLTDPNQAPSLAVALRNTQALEKRHSGMFKSNVTYDTVTVGMGAQQLGLNLEKKADFKEFEIKIEAPLNALIGQRGATAEEQQVIVAKLVKAQKEGIPAWEAAQIIADELSNARGEPPKPLDIQEFLPPGERASWGPSRGPTAREMGLAGAAPGPEDPAAGGGF
jgi:uncharacterized protein YoaH (UPF0181 family)